MEGISSNNVLNTVSPESTIIGSFDSKRHETQYSTFNYAPFMETRGGRT